MSAAFDTMTLNGLDFHVWWNHTDPDGDWPDAAILVRHPETGLLGTWDPSEGRDGGAINVFPEAPEIGSKQVALVVRHDEKALDQMLRLMEMVIREDA